MRHYELVLLVHPDQSEQMPGMLERYEEMITSGGGSIHRKEDWGRRPLAYTIQDMHKAHYILMNIECSQKIINELKNVLKFNDAVLRYLLLQKNEAVTEESPILRKEKEPTHRRDRDAA